MNNELLNGLTKEQIAKIKACKDHQEAFALAKQEGIELTEEQLEAVSNGCTSGIGSRNHTCPSCGKFCIADTKKREGRKIFLKYRRYKHTYWEEE